MTQPLDAPGLIAAATKAGASDIFLLSGYRPAAAINGAKGFLADLDVLTVDDVRRISDELKSNGAGHDYAGTSVRGPVVWPDYPEYGLSLRLT
ncbi:hypothetical protein [Arthrobacter sp. UYCo732]|uniref:hypothetical protein n=1 Tax=Arthrobacter sp. UYCo732 TaxID=3156336 RepID=UPI0033929811